MKLWITLVTFFVFVASSFIFSTEIIEPHFPLKALVYQALRLQNSDIPNMTVSKETSSVMEFTYQGKKYKATLFVYGGIYLEREGQNPLLLSFDIRDFRLSGNQ